MSNHMLSTSDNPFNPFLDYDEWFAWDTRAQYHTQGLLSRVIVSSHEASDTDQSLAIEYAIQDIMEVLGVLTTEDGSPLYIVVTEPEVTSRTA